MRNHMEKTLTVCSTSCTCRREESFWILVVLPLKSAPRYRTCQNFISLFKITFENKPNEDEGRVMLLGAGGGGEAAAGHQGDRARPRAEGRRPLRLRQVATPSPPPLLSPLSSPPLSSPHLLHSPSSPSTPRRRRCGCWCRWART